jgi:hypothetical protein
MDMWLLVQRFKIPTIFLSQKFIVQTNFERKYFIGYGEMNESFAFVMLPAFRNEIIPKFKIILTDKNETFYNLDQLKEECAIEILLEHRFTIEDYLSRFTRPNKTHYVTKKPKGLLIIEGEGEREREEEEQERKDPDNSKKTKIIKPKRVKKIVSVNPPLIIEEPLNPFANITNPEALLMPSLVVSEANLIKEQAQNLMSSTGKKTKKNTNVLTKKTRTRKNAK